MRPGRGVAGPALSGERIQGFCGRRWRWRRPRPVDTDGGWGLTVSYGELRLIQPGPGRQEMRFLREGAGPGGLPGGERKCHGLCRWVGGPGAGVFAGGIGSGVGGPRLQARLPTYPTLPSHPLQRLASGVHLAAPGGQMKRTILTAHQGALSGARPGQGLELHGELSSTNSLSPFCR